MIKLHSLPENLHWLTGRDAPDQRKVCTLKTEYSPLQIKKAYDAKFGF